MCDDHNCDRVKDKFRKRMQKLQGLSKALHCPTRWNIIEIIGSKAKKTNEIREELESRGYELSKSGFYYHLTELKDAGLIEVAKYVEEGKGAPEKEWKLSKKRIEIDLLE